jgi:ubiquinone biosynthesis protein COQ9
MTQDLTLDEIRAKLAPGIAANAAFDGWSDAARDMAAQAEGIDTDVAALAFKDGAVDMIDAWFTHIDAVMLAAIPPERLALMKIDATAADRESLRRAVTILALPQNLAKAARLGWRTVDTIWHAAGDVATDYNHYTKRTILLGVYASTITVFLDDESEGLAETRAFLGRRIEGIMQFEKAKAGFLKRTEHRFSLSRFVGRLRYPTA